MPPRGRPFRTPHPIEVHLKDLLRPSSVVAYGQIAKQIDASGLAAEEWLRSTIETRRQEARTAPDREFKKRTISVYRSAAAYYVEFVEKSATRDQAVLKMPKVRAAPEGRLRREFTTEQLARFREVAHAAPEPVRTILLLLPLTGCRISEVCYLERTGVDQVRRSITVLGKRGKRREVRLTRGAQDVLFQYLKSAPNLGERVFYRTETESGALLEDPQPFHPRDVWRYFGKAIRGDELLDGAALHQTRHTAATKMLKSGRSLKVIQDVLGHANIRSLERYLHTDMEDQAVAVEVLDE